MRLNLMNYETDTVGSIRNGVRLLNAVFFENEYKESFSRALYGYYIESI